MATVDFTTYTEVDVGSKTTVTASKIDSASNATQDNSYVYKDMGVNHFAGDFIHLFEVYVNSTTDAGQRHVLWAMSNYVGEQDAHQTNNQSYLGFSMGNETSNLLQRLYERDGSTADYTDTDAPSTSYRNSLLYTKVQRDEAIGTYGTLYSYTYSDSGRTTLIHSESIALHTSKKDFQYIYGSMNDGRTQAGQFTGYTQNLDLQEGASSSIKTINGLALASVKTLNGLAIASVKTVNGLA